MNSRAICVDLNMILNTPRPDWSKIGEIPMKPEGDGPTALNRHDEDFYLATQNHPGGCDVMNVDLDVDLDLGVIPEVHSDHPVAHTVDDSILDESTIEDIDFNLPINSAKHTELLEDTFPTLHKPPTSHLSLHVRKFCKQYNLRFPADYVGYEHTTVWNCKNGHVFEIAYKSLKDRARHGVSNIACPSCEIEHYEKEYDVKSTTQISGCFNRRIVIDWRCNKCEKKTSCRTSGLRRCDCTARSRRASARRTTSGKTNLERELSSLTDRVEFTYASRRRSPNF